MTSSERHELDFRELGWSGRLARRFQDSRIALLLAIAALLLGLFAVFTMPREEGPRVDVTFANVFVAFPGASAAEVEHAVTVPMEQVLAEVEGVHHTYSVSRPGMAVLTVQFEVGEERAAALARLYDAIYSDAIRPGRNWPPAGSGVLQPLVEPFVKPVVKTMGVDDVPILTVTLWTEDPERGAADLKRVAQSIEAEIERVPGTRSVYTIGGPDRVVHVTLDPQRLAAHGLSLEALRQALVGSNVVTHAGSIVADNAQVPVTAGTFLESASDVAGLVVGVVDGRPIYLEDVADVTDGPDQPESYVRFGTGAAAREIGRSPGISAPAVTLAVTKKPSAKASAVTDGVIARIAALNDIYIPQGVEMTLTHNEGKTADDQAEQLIGKLVLAAASVVGLAVLGLGWREGVVVGFAVVVTLGSTLFTSWALGLTLDRISLFALIFAIGIFAGGAIVLVESIRRHRDRECGHDHDHDHDHDRVEAAGVPMHSDAVSRAATLGNAISRAADEAGGPTILATLAVIAALTPMAFVTGFMGPYLRPIPIEVSAGMLLSLAAALALAPWAARKLLPARGRRARGRTLSERLARSVLGGFLGEGRGPRWARRGLFFGVAVAIGAAAGLLAVEPVGIKVLPFSDKSELRIVLDMPEGTPVEQTARVLDAMADYVRNVPEVTDYEVYAGLAAPINFDALVRQSYLRAGANAGDIQVNLADSVQRGRSSHEIAVAMRPALADIAAHFGAAVKVVESSSGSFVRAPLVAEVYGPSYDGQRGLATELHGLFVKTPGIVDADMSVEAGARGLLVKVDRQRAALLGVEQASVARALKTALSGEDAAYLHDEHRRYPVPVRLELSVSDKAELDSFLMLRVAGREGSLVPLSEVVQVADVEWEPAIYHKDLLPVVYVTGNMAGGLDGPLDVLPTLAAAIDDAPLGGRRIAEHFMSGPENFLDYGIQWDGEWRIAYETFRDLGIVYLVGLMLIYVLAVGYLRSYWLPLIVMLPIPFTMIGVLPGHALLGRDFTAASMIGVVALAGVVVRGSILLVDFARRELDRGGVALEEAVIRSVAIGTKPIVLTSLAAMLGALFMLGDPVFSGLAVSLIFGVIASTVLTLGVIPVLFYAAARRGQKPGSAHTLDGS